MRKLTTEEFIQNSNKIHNYKYNYSLSKYLSGKEKLVIICKEHGEFLQRASAHLEGQGCMECRLEKRRTGLEVFLSRCFEIHGNRYDYSLIKEYNNSRDKIKVICKKHGVFKVTPDNHSNRKQGCPECKKLGLEKFIEKSNIKHNSKYDYSLIKEYVNNKEKVEIICKEHGIFKQRIADHMLRGTGCPECAQFKLRTSVEDFIKRSKEIHGDKYDYSDNIEYKSNKDKIEITCKEHGVFTQRINAHLTGQGCPNCKESKGESEVRNYLFSNGIEFIQQKRFGDCVYHSELPFDFYLPEYNICIEYNGIQHYKPIEYFGGSEKFNYQLIRDEIKKEYCRNNNILLIIIKYDVDLYDVLDNYFLGYPSLPKASVSNL